MSFNLNYRTYADLTMCIKKNVNKLPSDYDLIVGIPRSGMIPAYMIALFMNKKVCSFDELINRVSPSHGDTRPVNNTNDNITKVLIVDDSVHSGFALKKAKDSLQKSGFRKITFSFLAIYAREESKHLVDYYFEILPSPRVFQWNYMNSFLLKDSCFDIDGVLCVDPTNEENDDGDRYRSFLLNAKPLFIPSLEIFALVTSRLEKYRSETEEWLKKHGVKYKKLYMLDLPSKEERIRLNAHAKFKAEIYSKLQEAKVFYESSRSQAIYIAETTGKPCFCTETDELFLGDGSKSINSSNNLTVDLNGKNVLLYSHELTYTGAPHSLLRMAKIYQSNGCKVELWTRLDGEFREQFEKIGINCKVITDKDVILSKTMEEISKFDFAIANTVISSKFYSVASKIIPTLWFIRESINLPSMVDAVPERLATLKNADRLYCVSEFAQDFISKTYNKNVTVVHNCVEDYFKENNKSIPEKINVIVVGNIKHNKGFDIAINAFNSLPNNYQNKIHLNLVGRCSEYDEEYCKEIFRLVNKNPNITYLGEIKDQTKKIELFKEMDVFLIPSRSESCSLVALEGAMMGKPLIVTENVGAKYMVTQNNGWVIPVNDIASLKEIFMDIVENPSMLIDMGEYSRKMYLEKASISQYEKSIIKVTIDHILAYENKLKRQGIKSNNTEIELLRKELNILQNELKMIKSSKCYRIAIIIQKLPKKTKGFFKCWKDHGLLYTIKHAISKIKQFLRSNKK